MLVTPGEARACGPFFPNRYLDAGTEQLLSAPEAFFADEIMRLLPPGTPRVEDRRYGDWRDGDMPSAAERSAETDVAELEAALRAGATGQSAAELAALVDAYRVARASGGEAPAGTPTEFALYLRGAQAWRRGEVETARAAWRELLALPEAERRWRSVRGAYMLGRSHLVLPEDGETELARDLTPREPERAAHWFGLAESLAAGGATDALGLAGEAKGWRARLLSERGNYPEATALYLERLAEGDDTAVQSLRRVARKAVSYAYGDAGAACARDERTRGVVVAFLLARGRPDYGWNDTSDWAELARRWAMQIHAAGVGAVRGADRLAWLAYEGGLFGLAEDWLKVAPADSAEADWLRSKLALRAGDAEAGARWLETALRADGLQGEHRRLACAELGRTRLALDQPEAALAAFLRGAHWEDASFVAERVLGVEELARLVDASPRELAGEPDMYPSGEAVGGVGMRHLLARRFLREDRGERALDYMPEPERGSLVEYLADLRMGFDPDRPARDRAEALWRAARMLKQSGMLLMGAALDPDWAVWDGAFEFDSTADARLGLPLLEGGLFAPTAEEQARIRRNPAPEKRFHYRYRAAELAWWAASLMPDQNEETARVLCEAGHWLAPRDPKAAEPFYRAMVLRCGDTELGRAARERRWLPPHLPATTAGG